MTYNAREAFTRNSTDGDDVAVRLQRCSDPDYARVSDAKLSKLALSNLCSELSNEQEPRSSALSYSYKCHECGKVGEPFFCFRVFFFTIQLATAGGGQCSVLSHQLGTT